jgi:ABC-type glycerol-3-phosphate transport system substrate-binding protein
MAFEHFAMTSRRRLLRRSLAAAFAGAALPLLQACGAAPPAPTVAPAARPAAEAPKPAAEAPKPAAEAAKPTVAPAAGQPSGSKTYKLLFAHDWTAGPRAAAIKFFFDEYKKAAPTVTIEAASLGGGAQTGSVGGLFETVVNQFVAGTAPDIIFAWPEAAPVWTRYLGDLTTLWKDKKADDLGIVDWPEITQVEGKRYAISFAPSTTGWYLNLTKVKSAGLPEPQDSWTWDDFLKIAQATTTPDGKNWGVFTARSWDTSSFNFVFGNMPNPSFWADPAKTKVGYDTPEALQGFKWYIDLIHKHKVLPGPAAATAMRTAETTNLFYLGLAAISGQWCQHNGAAHAFIKDRFEWKLMPNPISPNLKTDKNFHYGFTEPLVASKDGEKRGNLEASLDAMLFLTGSDLVQNYIGTLGNRPTIPVKASAFKGEAHMQPPPKNMQLIVKQLSDAKNAVNARPGVKYWAQWQFQTMAEIDKALIGEADAEKTWKNVVTVTQRLIDEAARGA